MAGYFDEWEGDCVTRNQAGVDHTCRGAAAEAAIQQEDDGTCPGSPEAFGQFVHAEGRVRQIGYARVVEN